MQILSSTALGAFSIQQISGVRSIGMRAQLAAILERGMGMGKILAEATENQESILWLTPVYGLITPYHLLPIDAKSSVRAALATIAKNIHSLAKGQSLGEGKQHIILGQILESLSITIANFLSGSPTTLQPFLVGDNLVLAGWGLEGIEQDTPTAAQEEHARAVLMTGVPPPEPVTSMYPPQAPQIVFNTRENQESAFWYILKTTLAALVTFIFLSLIALLLIPNLKSLVLVGKIYDPKKGYDKRQIEDLNEKIYVLSGNYLNLLTRYSLEEAQFELTALAKQREDLKKEELVAQADYSLKLPEPPHPAPGHSKA
jgi:hypothetical protein